MRSPSIRVAVAAASLLLGSLAASGRGPVRLPPPEQSVASFFAHRFERRDLLRISDAAVSRDRPYLTRRLHDLLRREIARTAEAAKASPEPAAFEPFIGGDPFTGTVDPPDGIRTGRVVRSGSTARVEVTGVASVEAPEPRTVTVVVVAAGSRWLVDNVVYQDGSDLVDLLSRPEYDSYGT